MTFNREFLIKLLRKLNNSDSYPMTKYSVTGLLTFKQLQINDKNIILDAIKNDVFRNGVFRNGDPLLVKQFWNENIIDPKSQI